MRKTLRRFRDLTPEKRRAVTIAGMLITVIQVGLAVLPFKRLMRLVYGAARPRKAVQQPAGGSSQFDRDLAVWAVEAAGRRLISRNPCLPKALAVLILMRRAGIAAELHMGVARESDGPVRAHAWVESEGRVVIGGDVALDQYTRLPGFEDKVPVAGKEVSG